MSEILYIGAVGRSGTTLLERTLATSAHLVALGELVHLWDRSVVANEPCGCGQPFDQCPFWVEVGRRAYGGWDAVDLDQLARDRRVVDRNRMIPQLIVPRLASASFRAARSRLLGVLNEMYTAIGVVAAGDGAPVVLIDSSKHPSYLYLLRSLPSHRVRLLHVVRDPRGVAHSWSKRVVRPESNDEMERLDTGRAIARWTSHNLLFHLCGLLGTPRRRMAYERFTADPTELVRVSQDVLGRTDDLGSDPASEHHDVRLGTDHTVSGNPMRFRSGIISIRSDEAWRSSMPARRRRLVGVATTPLRQLYAR